VTYYATNLLVYFGIDLLAVWGLNVQYGLCGVFNFGFILFQAAGAYTAAILTLGPSTANGYQSYFFGATLPFPLPILLGGVVAGALGALMAVLTRRVSKDYIAVVTFFLAVIVVLVVSGVTSFLNGTIGLASVPQPLESQLKLSSGSYDWVFVGFVAVLCLLALAGLRRLTRSPLGRALRAVREDDAAAASLGKNVAGLRMFVFVYGGFLAGVSGALLVSFIGAWSPGSWGYVETLTAISAIIIGGTANTYGAAIGVLIVQIIILQVPSYLPQLSNASLLGPVQGLAVAGLTLAFMFARPRGILPERKVVYDLRSETEIDRPSKQARPLPRRLLKRRELA
jgi:branched-chain amino acid transport system permease protein